MNNQTDRRTFLKKGLHVCGGCTLLFFGCKIKSTQNRKELDLDKLTYCGYHCEGCDFLKATTTFNLELKKNVYRRWKWKERLNVDFDPEIVFCWGCKPSQDKPINRFQERCSVRVCAIEKGKKNCVLCNELETCEKELWDRFPDQKKYCLDLQKKYKLKKRSGFINVLLGGQIDGRMLTGANRILKLKPRNIARR